MSVSRARRERDAQRKQSFVRENDLIEYVAGNHASNRNRMLQEQRDSSSQHLTQNRARRNPLEMSAGQHDFKYEAVFGKYNEQSRDLLQEDEYSDSCLGNQPWGDTAWNPISARGQFRAFTQSHTLNYNPTAMYPRHIPDSQVAIPCQISKYTTHTKTLAKECGSRSDEESESHSLLTPAPCVRAAVCSRQDAGSFVIEDNIAQNTAASRPNAPGISQSMANVQKKFPPMSRTTIHNVTPHNQTDCHAISNRTNFGDTIPPHRSAFLLMDDFLPLSTST